MQIVCLGAGAMGSYFGARLALADHTVTLVDPVWDHVEAARTRGLVLHEQGRTQHIEVAATTDPRAMLTADLLIVLTKAHQVHDALEAVPSLIARSHAVLVLPNGLGCGRVASHLVPAEKLLHGATAAGAILDEPGVVRHTVDGLTKFGTLAPALPAVAYVVQELLSGAGLPAEATEHVENWIWSKLLINIGYNAVTALTRTRNGFAVRHAEGRRILEAAVREAVAVAHARGITLLYDDPVGYVVELGLGVIGPNQSSMLQDVLRNRETEVAFLNEAVAREGALVGVPTPTNSLLAGLMQVWQDNACAGGTELPPAGRRTDQASG